MSRDALFAALGIIGALKDYKDAAAAIESAAAAIESAAKVIALLVAGWWTWQTYIRKRVKFPSGKVEHVISHWEDGGVKFLHVALRMTNTGNVMIPIAEGCTWIQQLTPLPTEIYEMVSMGQDPCNLVRLRWVGR